MAYDVGSMINLSLMNGLKTSLFQLKARRLKVKKIHYGCVEKFAC